MIAESLCQSECQIPKVLLWKAGRLMAVGIDILTVWILVLGVIKNPSK